MIEVAGLAVASCSKSLQSARIFEGSGGTFSINSNLRSMPVNDVCHGILMVMYRGHAA